MAKISIIVPCYNVQKYIGECIESILKQTLKDIEIICVNDGSTDNTLDILKSYEKKDKRVIVLTGANGGYGKAVNSGISIASGEYIGIIESDDFAAKHMFETLYVLSGYGSVDIVKANFWDYYAIEGQEPRAVVNNERHNMPDINEPFNIRMRPEILWGHPSVWSAIYKKDLILENNIKFIEAKGGGWVDNPFFFETLCKAKSIMWTKEPLYYYRKTNPESSSQRQSDPTLPFVRMMDNLDVIERNHYTDKVTLRYAYSRALMYLRGALAECDYDLNYDIINKYAKELMQRLDSDVLVSDFNTFDQKTYFEFASPIKSLSANNPKILIYNWLPYNQWGWGGGVTIYCKNLIDTIIKQYPGATIYFISSGFAYTATTADIFVRRIKSMFGERCKQYEIVNSPVPADQRYIYKNPLVALKNADLKKVFADFLEDYGPFSSIHFNNIEGLSLDVFDLKLVHPDTKFIYSIHNYIPMCPVCTYYQRHNHRNCNPNHTGEDCIKCTRTDVQNNLAKAVYDRGLFGIDPKDAISQNRWTKLLQFDRLDEDISSNEILKFAQTATEKINRNCDHILAVSKRVYEISAENGFDENKMSVSYIGTAVADQQVKHSLAEANNGLKIVFLGSDINYEEKGYPFLLDTLEMLDKKYASRIDLILTVRNKEHAEIYNMLKNFRSVRVINGYSHADLGNILNGCNLGIVPVLWEDNLPQIAIEMVAYGVPVLASSAGGASELCADEVFKFEAGNSKEFLTKIIHFLDRPEDLNRYWTYHQGLTTMTQHWDELREYYGLPKDYMIELSPKDYSFLLRENEFLYHNLAMNKSELERKLSDLTNERNMWEHRAHDAEYVKKSVSFRLGRFLTFLPRKIRNLFRRKK